MVAADAFCMLSVLVAHGLPQEQRDLRQGIVRWSRDATSRP
jgi:hypothetical protein